MDIVFFSLGKTVDIFSNLVLRENMQGGIVLLRKALTVESQISLAESSESKFASDKRI